MNNSRSRARIKGAMLTLALVVLTISSLFVQAQSRPPGPTSDRDRNLRDREMQITLLEKGVKEPPRRESRLLLREINEDFARLQVLNNEIKLRAAVGAVLDHKYLSDAAREIKKRSSRLRTNLVFPDYAKRDKTEKTIPTDGLRPQLVTLDRLIRSFVTNPVFTDAGVINAGLAARARGDLDDIIDLSDKIKKQAAKLNKANANSN
jgi:hypothetical protein